MKAAIQKGRDDASGGLVKIRGKRLLLADELDRVMTLDDGMLKAWSGGPCAWVTGRPLYGAQSYHFVWQAGIILAFNEGQMPKFDAMDTSMVRRMIYVPMRPKFVPAAALAAYDEPYTCAADDNIIHAFESWLPALLELLLEHYSPNNFTDADIPPSMLEWRTEAAIDANPVSGWIGDAIEVTGDARDCVLVSELCAAYGG